MKIAIGSDHGGYKLKESIKVYLEKKGHKINDFGTFSEESVDYPDYAKPVAKAIQKKKFSLGILICGTGMGICAVANRYKGILAMRITTEYDARMAKEHNNANILCFGGRTTTKAKATKMLDIFMKTRFAGGRHKKRLKKIDL